MMTTDLATVQPSPSAAVASAPVVLTGRDLLRQAVDLLEAEDFTQAESLLVDSLSLGCADSEDLRTWFSDYQRLLADRCTRREIRAQEHIAEARTRLAADEFQDALAEAFLAVRTSPDPQAIRSEDWLSELVDHCASQAEQFAADSQYTKAAVIYREISEIFLG